MAKDKREWGSTSRMIRQHYFEAGMDISEVAKDLDIKYQHVYNVVKKELDKRRKARRKEKTQPTD